MIFSGPVLVRWLRWFPPAFVIMGSTTTYMTAMALLCGAALVLPARASSRLEMALYSSYLRMISFWFETWSCVEVGARVASPRLLAHVIRLFLVLFLWRPSPRGTGECPLPLKPPVHQ